MPSAGGIGVTTGSAFDELVVRLDAVVIVKNENLQTRARRLATADGEHIPGEFDDVAEAAGVVARLEGEFTGCDEFLVGTGRWAAGGWIRPRLPGDAVR
jgi:hypothetical protein